MLPTVLKVWGIKLSSTFSAMSLQNKNRLCSKGLWRDLAGF